MGKILDNLNEKFSSSGDLISESIKNIKWNSGEGSTDPFMVTATVGTITTGDSDTYSFNYSNDVTYSKTYNEIKNAVDNGQPIVLSYDGNNYKCSAREESGKTTGKITLDAFSGFLDSATRPRYKTESFVIESDNTGQYIKTILVPYAIDGLNEYVMALQTFTGKIPFMNITGDMDNGISVTSSGITEDTNHALYAWGTQRGITPIFSFTYTNGDNETITKKLIKINGNAYEYDNHSLTRFWGTFKILINSTTLLRSNQNKEMFIGGTSDNALLHLKFVDDVDNEEFNVTTINGNISEGIIVPTEGETSFVAIPIDGKTVILRNISASNVSLATDEVIGNWRIV